jgi:myo-inositol catabolism protein IolC
MSNHEPVIGPLDTVAARNVVSRLYSTGIAPDPAVVRAARAKLATAKIDKAIRESMAACPGPLHPAQVEYLISQILAAGNKPVEQSEGE